MENKLSKAQIEAKTYVEAHNLEKIIGDMLNAMIYAKDPNPTVFMINFLANYANSEELDEQGISIPSIQHKKLDQKKPAEEVVKASTEIKEEAKENNSSTDIIIQNHVLNPDIPAESESIIKNSFDKDNQIIDDAENINNKIEQAEEEETTETEINNFIEEKKELESEENP